MHFSIITTSYNYENYIKETIESVISQTYPNWEMIIVDDGSKDNSIEVIKEYCKKDSRIKLFTHSNNQNRGLIETVKLGINKAQNDWLVFLESDDTIAPNYLEKKLEAIKQNSDISFIFNDVNLFGNTERISAFDKYFKITKEYLKNNPYPNNQLEIFKKYNLVPTFSCVALKKELFNRIDFNSPIKTLLDYYIWMQIAQKTSFYYIDEKLTNWRMHDSYITKNKTSSIEKYGFKYKKFKLTHPKLTYLMPFLKIHCTLQGIRKSIIRMSIKERKICLFDKPYYPFGQRKEEKSAV